MIAFALFLLLISFLPQPIRAFYEPLSVPNNKYGIHIAELTDLKDAAGLVNSNGGDWGYVTLVIQDGDRNVGKWQEIFNSMRRLHLIPILRLATHPEGDSWKIPQKEDAKRWVSFLDSLIWPIENRYVILFNEPNHSKEWGNTINPEEYADVALFYAAALKEQSPDFFILPAGFDMSASSDGQAMEASEYIKRMYSSKPEFFSKIDGWTSHSYPNPGFSGSPYAMGKGTIASFLWELQFLNSLGITKPYPLFITETGWTHNEGKYSGGRLTPGDVANNLTLAASGVWNNPRIVAITPFLLNYQGSPFDNFSWKKLNSSEFHPQYQMYQKLVKTKGMPNQHESYQLKEPLFPDTLVTNSTYTLEGELTNTGQGIVDPDNGYEITVNGLDKGFSYLPDPLPKLEPTEKGPVKIHVRTPLEEGVYHVTCSITRGQKKIVVEEKDVTLIPPPTMTLQMTLGWKKESKADHVLILVYDHEDTLLHKFQDLTVENGSLTVTGLYNMIPGKSYRIVVVAPYYLPRQQIVTLKEGRTTESLKRLLPFDFNKDGTLNMLDLPALLFTKPNEVFTRFF
jgi:hypothetical protein